MTQDQGLRQIPTSGSRTKIEDDLTVTEGNTGSESMTEPVRERDKKESSNRYRGRMKSRKTRSQTQSGAGG